MNSNLFALLAARRPGDGGRTVLETDSGRRFSYDDMETATAAYAALFARLGLEPGDRLAARVDKSPEALFLYLACLRHGLVYLPLNTAYTRAEMGYFFEDAEPALVVGRPADEPDLSRVLPGGARLLSLDHDGSGSLAEAVLAGGGGHPCRRLGGDAPAAIVYTSGTTGRPKGAVISHGNLASNARTLVAAWGFTGADTLLHVLPLFHVHGLFVACHCVLWSGAGMRLLRDASTENIMRCLDGASVMMGVPTHYTRLLDDPGFSREHCQSIRVFISGSAPLLPRTFEAFEQRTGHRILERYGMTETGMNTSNPLDGPRLPGTVGPPLPGVQTRIMKPDGEPAANGEIGMLEVRGANVFNGYWRNPEKTREAFTDDGYFITGDLASRDPGGYLRIEGRKKDLIITGGYNVYPKEIELGIDRQPEVAESAVVGLPHDDYGEAVAAVVVLNQGGALAAETLVERLRSELASYKCPKYVYFLEALPRNAMGKVQKNVLRERFAPLASRTDAGV